MVLAPSSSASAPVRRPRPEVSTKKTTKRKRRKAYRPAGETISGWLESVGHVLTDLDGTSKPSRGERLAFQGTCIYAGSAAAKLNAYGGADYRKNRRFLETEGIIRLAAFCGREPFEAVALALKNGFERFVKIVIAPRDEVIRPTFEETLTWACNDDEAIERATDFLVEVYQEAIAESRRLFAEGAGTAGLSEDDLFSLDTCAEAIHLPVPDLARVLSESQELGRFAIETYESSWTVFGDAGAAGALGEVVRSMRDPKNAGSPFPYVHYHDLQGAFAGPCLPAFDENVSRIDPANRVALRLGCIFLVGGTPVAFPCGRGRYSIVTAVDRDCVPMAGIVDHLASLAAHIRRHVPAPTVEGTLAPYGVRVHENEEVSVSPHTSFACGWSIQYLYVATWREELGPWTGGVPAHVVSGMLPGGEMAMIDHVCGEANPHALRNGDAIILPFSHETSSLFTKRLSVRPHADESGNASPVVSVSVLPVI
jgi:hypothetical protein